MDPVLNRTADDMVSLHIPRESEYFEEAVYHYQQAQVFQRQADISTFRFEQFQKNALGYANNNEFALKMEMWFAQFKTTTALEQCSRLIRFANHNDFEFELVKKRDYDVAEGYRRLIQEEEDEFAEDSYNYEESEPVVSEYTPDPTESNETSYPSAMTDPSQVVFSSEITHPSEVNHPSHVNHDSDFDI